MRPGFYVTESGRYRGCLTIGPDIIWSCPHEHEARAKSPAPALPDRGPALTSALDCAKAEMSRRAARAEA